MSATIAHGTNPGREMAPELPGTVRSIATGAAIGCVAAMAGVGGALFLSGHSTSVALGIGGMAAFWGGLGFGSMLGGTMHLMRHSDEPGPSPRPTGGAQDAAGASGS